MIYADSSSDDFELWLEKNDDELWCEFHETGACYDGDYDAWLEWKYANHLSRKEDK